MADTAGIKRIRITDGMSRGGWRQEMAQKHEPIMNSLYRQIFPSINFQIAPGIEIVKVSKDEAVARYDWEDGIDVILTSASGMRATLQEKVLTYWKSTATFEEKKASGEPGAWYYCTAQYYFVGYSRLYWDYRNRRIKDDFVIDLQDWILLDLPALRRKSNVEWEFDENKFDGRKSTFRFANFNSFPADCVISRYPLSSPLLKSKEKKKSPQLSLDLF